MYIKRFALFLILLALPLQGFSPIGDILFDQLGEPSAPLLDVLSYYQVSHDETWESITDETQTNWLRKKGSERWELYGDLPEHAILEYGLFSSLNMTSAICPVDTSYDYAIILGATVQPAQERLMFLKQMWDRGVRFKTLVLLGAERPLAPFEKEGWDFDGDVPETETEMMVALVDGLDLPEEWQEIPLEIVDTPMKGDKRPNTADTFRAWLETNPTPGLLLVVSNQPFIGRQDSVAREELPFFFAIDSIGPGVSLEVFEESEQAISVMKDELARWIYTHSCS